VTHLTTLQVGTIHEGPTSSRNVGLPVLAQSTTAAHNGATAVSTLITLPANAQIIDVVVDVVVAIAGSTVSAISAGSAAAGTQYGTIADVDTTAAPEGFRFRLSKTVAQLLAMSNIGANTSLYLTWTPTGTTTTGTLRYTVTYTIPEA
jgi:predicted amino acid racemase